MTVTARADDSLATKSGTVFIESAQVKNMGWGHVGITVRNRSSSDVAVAIDAREPGRPRGSMNSASIDASSASRVGVSMPWPKKCGTTATESEVRLLTPKTPTPGVTIDATPFLVRLTPGACKVTRALLDDPVANDHLTSTELATKNKNRLYYRHPRIMSTPSSCGDQLVVQAELVNATTQTIFHAGLRIPQAGLVPDSGVTLAPGETRVVTRAAKWEGTMVPILLEATHDDAGTNALAYGELMKGYTAGVSFLDECAMSVSLTKSTTP